MNSIEDKCRRLTAVYKQEIRQHVKKWTPDRVQSFDDQFERLEKLSNEYEEPIRIGLLGSAAAGKSTLLNAIAFKGQSILPTGGVGALTAQATRIVHSETPYFRVKYKNVRQFLQGQILALSRSLGLFKKDNKDLKNLDNNSIQDAEDILTGLKDEIGGPNEKKDFEKQVSLLIKGDQDSPVQPSDLLGALELILDNELSIQAPDLTDDDYHRIQRLKNIISNGCKDHKLEGRWNNRDFRTDLRDHAAGFLAPVVTGLEVGYPWELICENDHLELIDLPGVGVSRDSYVSVTESFIRDKAQAIILVVNRSGIEESSRNLLEQSGFLQRLLHSADHPESDPLLLFVVATKTDEVVIDKVDGAEQVGETLSYVEVMKNVQSDLKSHLRNQLRVELNDIASKKSGLAKEAADNVINYVLDTAQFHAVSNSEYGLFLYPKKRQQPFIEYEDQSGIPDLTFEISDAVDKLKKQRSDALQTSLNQIEQQLNRWVNTVSQRYIFTKLAKEKSVALQKTLRDDLAPLLKEFQVRLGKFHEFLNEGVNQILETILAKGSQAASEDIRRYLSSLRDMHWASLRATIRKRGTHRGINVIDLPHIFSDHFEGQLVPFWQTEVLKRLGKRIEELAQDLSAIVKEMALWAESHELSKGNIAVSVMADQMRGDIDQLSLLIEESNQNLREMVRKKLYQTIRKPIDEHCQEFCNTGEDIGPGVKVRTLDCFDGMVVPALKSACEQAKIIFKQSLDNTGQIIRDCLKPYVNIQNTIEEQILPVIDAQQQAEFDLLQPKADVATKIVRQALVDLSVERIENLNKDEAELSSRARQ